MGAVELRPEVVGVVRQGGG